MKKGRKGIILAGGNGSRLFPITLGVNKHLLPVYDKPMIFYPLSTILLCDIQDIAIVCKTEDKTSFHKLLGDGSDFGVNIQYLIQEAPSGLPDGYIISQNFLDDAPSVMVLGDNIHYGSDLSKILKEKSNDLDNNYIFTYKVSNPSRYGVATFSSNRIVKKIIEKPDQYISEDAVTGLYCLDSSAPERSKELIRSSRGELEIADLLNKYIEEKKLSTTPMGRGYAWLDTGTYSSLHSASSFIKTIQDNQGNMIGSPHEIAWRNGKIDDEKLLEIVYRFNGTPYSKYLDSLFKK